ncbi:MAG: 50S ribosomal protein L25, partial [Sorangiineae bacterium PRO1]|nr:50S ribosomal protein L25 [Sorangiineae bacterium PRO1]
AAAAGAAGGPAPAPAAAPAAGVTGAAGAGERSAEDQPCGCERRVAKR